MLHRLFIALINYYPILKKKISDYLKKFCCNPEDAWSRSKGYNNNNDSKNINNYYNENY